MFKKGDRVICVDARARSCLSHGSIYTIIESQRILFVSVGGINEWFFARRFKLYEKTIAYPTLRKNYV